MNTNVSVPNQINLKKKSGILEISWKNGDSIKISCQDLRRFCACSGCRARNLVGSLLINESTTVENLAMMGSTGLQIGFSDGHARGVFPWAYLRAISEGRAMEFIREQ